MHNQDRADFLHYVANQLHGGGAHRILRIDRQCNVINVLPANCALRDQQLLIFAPIELGSQGRCSVVASGEITRLIISRKESPAGGWRLLR